MAVIAPFLTVEYDNRPQGCHFLNLVNEEDWLELIQLDELEWIVSPVILLLRERIGQMEPTVHTASKNRGGLKDLASLATLRGFTTYTSDTNGEESRGKHTLAKAPTNHFQQRPLKLKCDCILTSNEKLLLGWEFYKPRKFYANTNQPSRSNSTDVLRRLLSDQVYRKKSHGRPTALTRLIDGMKKPPPKPEYEYGNCLQQTLTFDDHKMQYGFVGKLIYTPPDIDDVYLNKGRQQKRARRNPFVAVQLCPASLYKIFDQPVGLEYVSRGFSLIDPMKW